MSEAWPYVTARGPDGEPLTVEWRPAGPGVHLGAPDGCTCGCEHPPVSQEELLGVMLPGGVWADVRRDLLQGGSDG